ncbi:MAG: aldolase/citrate lyase family protein [Ilumatobacteraceae bacterium]
MRSVLYMPGANERALEKAATLPADALILDLEDAVAPGRQGRGAGSRLRRREVGTLRTPSGDDPRQRPRDAMARRRHRRRSPPPVPTRSWCRRSTQRPTSLPSSAALDASGASESTMRCGRWSRRRSAMLHAHEIATASDRLDRARDGHERPRQGARRPSTCPGGRRSLTGLSLCLLAARVSRHGDPRRRLQRRQGSRRASPPSARRAGRWASTARR